MQSKIYSALFALLTICTSLVFPFAHADEDPQMTLQSDFTPIVFHQEDSKKFGLNRVFLSPLLADDLKGTAFDYELKRMDPSDPTSEVILRKPRLLAAARAMHIKNIFILARDAAGAVTMLPPLAVEQNIAAAEIDLAADFPVLPFAVLSPLEFTLPGATVEVAIGFEVLEEGTVQECKALATFEKKVFSQMEEFKCAKCHAPTSKSGARLKFPMTNDIAALCRDSLQRVHRTDPENLSPLIQYPLRKANGHTLIISNWQFAKKDWLKWIAEEFPADVAGEATPH